MSQALNSVSRQQAATSPATPIKPCSPVPIDPSLLRHIGGGTLPVRGW
jgi:hypothetical protein